MPRHCRSDSALKAESCAPALQSFANQLGGGVSLSCENQLERFAEIRPRTERDRLGGDRFIGESSHGHCMDAICRSIERWDFEAALLIGRRRYHTSLPRPADILEQDIDPFSRAAIRPVTTPSMLRSFCGAGIIKS